MTEQNKKALWFILAILIIAYVLNRVINSRNAEYAQVVDSAPVNNFYAPYYYTVPGVDPSNTPGFESTVNVYVDNPALAGLDNKYIPIFGLVGMTAVSGQ